LLAVRQKAKRLSTSFPLSVDKDRATLDGDGGHYPHTKLRKKIDNLLKKEVFF
jgi:hypothetical protein